MKFLAGLMKCDRNDLSKAINIYINAAQVRLVGDYLSLIGANEFRIISQLCTT